MSDFLYDETDRKSIIEYAQRLENRTVDEVNVEQNSFAGKFFGNTSAYDAITQIANASKNYKGKGGFGNFLEEVYFGKENDNKSEADFPFAKLELKVSPLKFLSDKKTVRVKERLVLNHFTFADIDKEIFDNSHFKSKNENILLVFYFHDANKPFGELAVNLADLWQCLKEDEAQLRSDWQTIADKVHAGKAHEISEGDTLYLGACTKGATAESSMQSQPHSDIKARGRALCFKSNYINQIYQTLVQRKVNGRNYEERLLTGNETFEDRINTLYAPFLGMMTPDIYKKLGVEYNLWNKSRYANIARKIVGLKKTEDNIYEFNASGIQLKTIRVEPNGKSIESMSFKNVDFCGIVDEEWEDSDFYSAIVSKFILVLFKRDEGQTEYYLDKVVFWQIPEKDFEIFHSVWEHTKNRIIANDYEHFTKMSDNRVSHIRPKGKDSTDLMETPKGTFEKKKCFWINQEYLQKEVLDKLYKNKSEQPGLFE